MKKPTKKIDKIKDYDTAIKPSAYGITNLKRVEISNKIVDKEIGVYSIKNDELIELNKNNSHLVIAKELSTLRYRIENVYLSDLCNSLYTLITTMAKGDLKSVFKDLQYTKNNGLRFLIDKENLYKIAYGTITTASGVSKRGCGDVKEYVKKVLDDILSSKKGVPMCIVSLKDYQLANGERKDIVVKIPPMVIHSVIQNRTDNLEFYEIELSGLLYPTEMNKLGKYKAITSYYHSPTNLSVLLSVGEDLFVQTDEYKLSNKKISFEVARRFIELLQMSYNLKHNLPDCSKTITETTLEVKVTDDTLYALYPKSFRSKHYIRRPEFIWAANLSATYFHLAITHLRKTKSIKNNKFLVIPLKKDFCTFNLDEDFCTLRATIN